MTPLQVATLRKFRSLRIRYLLVGGQAMRARGIDRQTSDLDLWIARDKANAEALTRFLDRVQDRPPLERLQQPNLKFTVGISEVDILTSVAGDPKFEDCLARSHTLFLDGQRLPVISARDLLAVKQASALVMDRDATDSRLTAEQQYAAARTATKERRDVVLLRLLIAAGG